MKKSKKLGRLLIGGAFLMGLATEAMAQAAGIGSNPISAFKRGFNIILGIVFIIAALMCVWWVIEGARHMKRGDPEGASNAFIAAAISAGADIVVAAIWGAFGKQFDLNPTQ